MIPHAEARTIPQVRAFWLRENAQGIGLAASLGIFNHSTQGNRITEAMATDANCAPVYYIIRNFAIGAGHEFHVFL
jgi:hypothetical protein